MCVWACSDVIYGELQDHSIFIIRRVLSPQSLIAGKHLCSFFYSLNLYEL